MIRAKNYQTASKFVKVMPRNTVASFFPDTVYGAIQFSNIPNLGKDSWSICGLLLFIVE